MSQTEREATPAEVTQAKHEAEAVSKIIKDAVQEAMHRCGHPDTMLYVALSATRACSELVLDAGRIATGLPLSNDMIDDYFRYIRSTLDPAPVVAVEPARPPRTRPVLAFSREG